MSFPRRSLLASLAAVLLSLSACTTAPPAPPVVMPPPVKSPPLLTPSTFAALPGWDKDDLREAWPAFMKSCSAMQRKPDWAAPCAAARAVDSADGQAIRAFFESNFVPNQVRAPDGADTGLITGYYEPLLHGARSRGGPFQTPLLRVPDDLITVDLASIYPELKGMRLRGKLVGKKLVPYSNRAEIEQAEANSSPLLWVDDPVEAFFLQVQGSGRVQLADTNETVRVAYADQNGFPYKSIGRWLVDKGELTFEQATAQGIKAWVAAHPAREQELFNANPSYVFFKEERLPDPSVGPKGALGVALTPARSVAIDAQMLPLGVPMYLSTTQAASDVPLQRLVMAQDTGGAIRGAIRADFFFGFGSGAAESAGRMKQRGMLWVLLPRASTER
jgi:membrane-bound lytic murein transglycosylase A